MSGLSIQKFQKLKSNWDEKDYRKDVFAVKDIDIWVHATSFYLKFSILRESMINLSNYL